MMTLKCDEQAVHVATSPNNYFPSLLSSTQHCVA